MHRQNMPPLVVLGLTGPIGSGCTTVGEIFTHGKDLMNILRFLLGWMSHDEERLNINWEILNKEVDDQYKRLDQVRKIMREYKHFKIDNEPRQIKLRENEIRNEIERSFDKELEGDLEEELRSVEIDFKEYLSRILEIREEVKALDKLNYYYRERNDLFQTISVSTLIVFLAMVYIDKEDIKTKGKGNTKKILYNKFIAIAKKHISNKEVRRDLKKNGIEKYADLYEKIKFCNDESGISKLCDIFSKTYSIASKIKKEFQKKWPYVYSEFLQDFGDNIRKCGNPFGNDNTRLSDSAYKLGEILSEIIHLYYKANRAAFITIDCLRNPYEVIFLRREFANFFLLSLYADRETRKQRFLKNAKKNLKQKFDEKKVIRMFDDLDIRDSGEEIEGAEVLYKQNVTKCVQVSDIAINNMVERPDIDIDVRKTRIEDLDIDKIKEIAKIMREFYRKPLRMLCLVLSPGCTKPTREEIFMNMAYTMAVKSNCISRQVGAIIVGSKGYVVGAGWNDKAEGRISCGLRAIRDLANKEFGPYVKALVESNNEKYSEEEVNKLIMRLCESIKNKNKGIRDEQFCFCFKDEMANKIVSKNIKKAMDKINKELLSKGKDKINFGINKIRNVVKKAKVHQLEFCLALHAEENAIIQGAKIGGMGLKGGSIFTTSQPCTLCAKKIEQVGLERVVYTEAYPASLSDIYMKDVKLEQFEGVKPRGYIKLFMPHHDQKKWQYLESQNLVPMI